MLTISNLANMNADRATIDYGEPEGGGGGGNNEKGPPGGGGSEQHLPEGGGVGGGSGNEQGPPVGNGGGGRGRGQNAGGSKAQQKVFFYILGTSIIFPYHFTH